MNKANAPEDLPIDVRLAYAEADLNSCPFNDGHIFRQIRLHHNTQNTYYEKKWLARLSPGKQRDLKQLIEWYPSVTTALDRLLPFLGLWQALQLGTFHRLLSIRCSEEICHYLSHIYLVWTAITASSSPQTVDHATVTGLEGRSPFWSHHDMRVVETYLNSGRIFSLINDHQTKSQVKETLRGIRMMIPSLHTFLADTKYLEPCAQILQTLLPEQWRAMRRLSVCHGLTNIFAPATGFEQAYREIWIFCFANYASMTQIGPRKDPKKPNPRQSFSQDCWHRIAVLALRLGFRSEKIQELANQDPSLVFARSALTDLRCSGYQIDDTAFATGVDEMRRVLQAVKSIFSSNSSSPFLTSDTSPSWKIELRCGRPYEQAYLNDREHLSPQWVYGTEDIPRENITTFAVSRDIISAFLPSPSMSENQADFIDEPPPLSPPAAPLTGLRQADNPPEELRTDVELGAIETAMVDFNNDLVLHHLQNLEPNDELSLFPRAEQQREIFPHHYEDQAAVQENAIATRATIFPRADDALGAGQTDASDTHTFNILQDIPHFVVSATHPLAQNRTGMMLDVERRLGYCLRPGAPAVSLLPYIGGYRCFSIPVFDQERIHCRLVNLDAALRVVAQARIVIMSPSVIPTIGALIGAPCWATHWPRFDGHWRAPQLHHIEEEI